jgi:Ca2+-binding RTX toxin-like protein
VARDFRRSRTRTGLLAGAAVAALLALPAVASAAVTSSVTAGVLSVSSDADDAIAITSAGGNVKINGADPGSGAVAAGAITRIEVDGGPGGNAIDLTGVTKAAFPAVASVLADGNGGVDTILGSEHADRPIGGDGADTTEGRDGDDTLVWNPGDDSDVNEGGAGNDTIEVNGGNGNEQFTVKPSATAGRVAFERSAASAGGLFTLDIGTSERLDMNANGGNDNFTADGALDALGFKLDVDGGAGNDVLDGGDGADLIDGGEGDDRVIGDNNPLNTTDVSRGGLGDDTMVWNPGDGDDANEGGDGTDTVEVNGGGGNENFSVKPSAGHLQFERDAASAGGRFVIDISTSERLDMNANNGNDTFVAENGLDAVGFRLDVDGGAGNDDLDGGDGPDLIDGGDGNDRIAGDDNPASTHDVSLGGAGDDTMVWNPGDDDDVNEGGDGNDTSVVNGAGGDERFKVAPSATAGRVQFDRTDPAPFSVDIGTTENLLVNAGGGDDRIRGSKHLAGLIASTFNGDDGNDRIRGTDGADQLTGGKGFDRITSIDKAADSVQCGAGVDVAFVDRRDTVQGCEFVFGGALKVALVGKAALAGDVVALRLRCVATARCKGSARLRHGGRKLGGSRFKLQRGETKTIRVQLNKRGRRLIANHSGETVRMKLRLVSRDNKGNGWRTTKRIKLHP